MVTPPQIKCEQDISKEESGFPIVGQGGMGGDPNFMIFLNPPPPPTKTDAIPWGAPLLKN